MSYQIVIPARYASSRLPGKPLRDIAGKPMIQHVYDRAMQTSAKSVVVATDDQRIVEAVTAFGGQVVMTSADHQSGTERLAEVADKMGWADDTQVINVQGDEPLIEPEVIEQLADTLAQCDSMATLATPMNSLEDVLDPNLVKLILDQQGRAIYFSRAPIPWARDSWSEGANELPVGVTFLRHLGMYGYRVEILRRYPTLAPSPLESIEMLEQLRLVWHGIPIYVQVVDKPLPPGVDTEEDLRKVTQIISQ